MNIRTRFAPSPTGYLHIGGARTALFSWLYAKKHNGTFILRIEDTDLERSTESASAAILSAMTWLGLDYAEGPFYQTKRFARYKEVADSLLAAGLGYRCYCSKERLEILRQEQEEKKVKPKYDSLCREKNHPHRDVPYVLRFKNPVLGTVTVDDVVRGKVTVNNSEMDDLVIFRSDGSPTYNFSVVVDDMDMRITHVIRGEDHLTNTPRQINMLEALGATPPVYAHVPLILGSDGKRLSKRHGAVSVEYYKELGILPEALLNYLVRLGWAHKDQEIFSLAEMVEYFDLSHIHKAPAQFDMDKLMWVNQQYLKNNCPNTINALEQEFRAAGVVEQYPSPSIEDILNMQLGKFKTTKEFVSKNLYFYQAPTNITHEAVALPLNIITTVYDCLAVVEEQDWNKESLHLLIQNLLKTLNMKMPDLAKPLRIILTGDSNSGSLDATIALLGKAEVLSRINNFING